MNRPRYPVQETLSPERIAEMVAQFLSAEERTFVQRVTASKPEAVSLLANEERPHFRDGREVALWWLGICRRVGVPTEVN